MLQFIKNHSKDIAYIQFPDTSLQLECLLGLTLSVPLHCAEDLHIFCPKTNCKEGQTGLRRPNTCILYNSAHSEEDSVLTGFSTVPFLVADTSFRTV